MEGIIMVYNTVNPADIDFEKWWGIHKDDLIKEFAKRCFLAGYDAGYDIGWKEGLEDYSPVV
jgi:hypothetical protein